MSWTQPACDDCWDERNPDRPARRIIAGYRATEKCCYCGGATTSGIYVRENPDTVPHPTLEDA